MALASQQAYVDRHRFSTKSLAVNPTDDSLNYGVVIDCGSSGSRVFVYYWPPHSGEQNHLLNIQLMRDSSGQPVVKKIEPGLSTYISHPYDASEHIATLLSFAAAHIPKLKHKQTSAYVMATAGMRLLHQKDQDTILEDLRIDLPHQFEFLFSTSHVEVISGKQEGIYSWIAINYALGKFDHKISDADKLVAVELPGIDKIHMRKRTVGILDLGGASLQIAYEVPRQEKFDPKDEASKSLLAEFNLGCTNTDLDHMYRVYVATFLGVGSNAARSHYENYLVMSNLPGNLTGNVTSDHVLHDPCLPIDRLEQLSHDGYTLTVRGTGNLNTCVQSIKPLINKTSCLSKSPCAMHGVYQPEISSDNSEFYGFSEFYYSMEDLLSMGGRYEHIRFKQSARKYCATNWTTIEGWQSAGQYPRADSNRYRLQCFKSAWLLALLHHGLDFPVHYKHLTSVQFLQGHEVHWSLGALLYKTKFFPLRDIEKRQSSLHQQSAWQTTSDLRQSHALALFVFLFVSVLVCLYVFKQRRRGGNVSTFRRTV